MYFPCLWVWNSLGHFSLILNVSLFLRHPSHYLLKYFHLSFFSPKETLKIVENSTFILKFLIFNLYSSCPYCFRYHVEKLLTFIFKTINFLVLFAMLYKNIWCLQPTLILFLPRVSHGCVCARATRERQDHCTCNRGWARPWIWAWQGIISGSTLDQELSPIYSSNVDGEELEEGEYSEAGASAWISFHIFASQEASISTLPLFLYHRPVPTGTAVFCLSFAVGQAGIS